MCYSEKYNIYKENMIDSSKDMPAAAMVIKPETNILDLDQAVKEKARSIRVPSERVRLLLNIFHKIIPTGGLNNADFEELGEELKEMDETSFSISDFKRAYRDLFGVEIEEGNPTINGQLILKEKISSQISAKKLATILEVGIPITERDDDIKQLEQPQELSISPTLKTE